jgi:predicted nucleic acid-binding protein
MKYVVDTNIFSNLVDGTLSPDMLPSDGDFVVTHIQIDELDNTTNDELRARLRTKFTEIAPQVVPTESAISDLSRADRCKVGNGRICQAVKTELDALNRRKPNNVKDALIAEVAIVNGFSLLTSDCDLSKVVRKYGARVCHLARKP